MLRTITTTGTLLVALHEIIVSGEFEVISRKAEVAR
jgi:hypothetical protein